ncbi:hypothetical protein NLC27_03495, partial [Candidatus Aminicenantes bacterium AC-708-I09]|nr:hypothetical protein [Candidatus Aminicenantes bacterium AC-708-I09]
MKKSKKVLLILLILGISLLIVNLLFYFTSPSLLDSYFQKKSLLDLKKKSRIISQKWYSLFSKIEEIKKKVKE